MLYLEDYLEMIEHLPQELKDRFTEIRELDLQVQNASDKLDDRVKNFFGSAKRMKLTDRDVEFDAIRKEYYKALEDADEKVHQATDLYNLVERYLRRLDQELHKFKMELEADNAGITEVLERRSREVEQQNCKERDRDILMSQKENRFLVPVTAKSDKKERKVSVEKSGGSAPGTPTAASGISLGNIGVGGNAIAAAASQAIAATHRMQEGRRTASFRTSYEAINMGLQGQEFSVGIDLLANAELHEAARQAMAVTTSTGGKEQKRNKRKSQHTQNQDLMQVPEEFLEEPVIAPLETPEWAYDPTEPRYCLCNQVSYGDMVACDNEDCPIEWFHYPCVGITATPKGKWYCPQCSSSLKRRGRR